MKIRSVFDESFSAYGAVVTGYDFAPLLVTLKATTPRPTGGTVYKASDAGLEALEIAAQLSTNAYGGMPIQVGYCNGDNRSLNCLEYHRGSEINIAAEDAVLLVSSLQKVKEGTLDTSQVEAFLLPAGCGVLLYETTLHYAPCNALGNDGFRVVIVLPKGTNTEKPAIQELNLEDKLLWARNKWLIAHPDTNEAKQGAFVGLSGPNITLEKE